MEQERFAAVDRYSADLPVPADAALEAGAALAPAARGAETGEVLGTIAYMAPEQVEGLTWGRLRTVMRLRACCLSVSRAKHRTPASSR